MGLSLLSVSPLLFLQASGDLDSSLGGLELEMRTEYEITVLTLLLI